MSTDTDAEGVVDFDEDNRFADFEADKGYQLEKDDADSGDDPDSGLDDYEELDDYYH